MMNFGEGGATNEMQTPNLKLSKICYFPSLAKGIWFECYGNVAVNWGLVRGIQ